MVLVCSQARCSTSLNYSWVLSLRSLSLSLSLFFSLSCSFLRSLALALSCFLLHSLSCTLSLSLARYRFLMVYSVAHSIVRCFRAISAVGSRRLRRSSGVVNSRGAPALSMPPPLSQSQVSQQPAVLAEKSSPQVASVSCATPSGQSGDNAVAASVGDPSAVASDGVTQAGIPPTSESQTAPVT